MSWALRSKCVARKPHFFIGLAEEFVIRGGELLVIDEIHKYHPGTTDWSREIKEIYELFPNLKVIVSGSSLLQLREGDADLSRRAVKYTMPGLSFREALRFYHGLTFPVWSLEDILAHPYDLWQTVSAKCKPVVLFKEYLEKGYYPFLLEGEGEYYTKIEQMVNYYLCNHYQWIRLQNLNAQAFIPIKKTNFFLKNLGNVYFCSAKKSRKGV